MDHAQKAAGLLADYDRERIAPVESDETSREYFLARMLAEAQVEATLAVASALERHVGQQAEIWGRPADAGVEETIGFGRDPQAVTPEFQVFEEGSAVRAGYEALRRDPWRGQATVTPEMRAFDQAAAETALAEANHVIEQMKRHGCDWLVEEAKKAIEAAERRANELADALRDFEGAVRVYDVMLNEPAAEGLMSAEDYSAYLRGAWLGVEEAAVVARAALDRHTPTPTGQGGVT